MWYVVLRESRVVLAFLPSDVYRSGSHDSGSGLDDSRYVRRSSLDYTVVDRPVLRHTVHVSTRPVRQGTTRGDVRISSESWVCVVRGLHT